MIDCYETCENCSGPNFNQCTGCFPPRVLSQGECISNFPIIHRIIMKILIFSIKFVILIVQLASALLLMNVQAAVH